MKKLSICVTMSFLVFSGACDNVGCQNIGGGLAGASFDSAARRREVDNYEGTTSTVIRESVIDNSPTSSPKQHFDDIMRSFPTSVQRVDEMLIRVPSTSFEAQYTRNTFILRASGRVIVNQQLPAVFNMHPVRLGVGTLSGRRIVMITNKSRATTARCFVAIYGQDGEALYTRVLRGGERWDINATADAIEIIGGKKTRRITISKGG